jgi:hypothetical protein
MIETAKPTVQVVQSELDGCWVVQIDTDPAYSEPLVRIYLNEATLHENPRFPMSAGKAGY